MSARGVLANPALFTGLDKTPGVLLRCFAFGDSIWFAVQTCTIPFSQINGRRYTEKICESNK